MSRRQQSEFYNPLFKTKSTADMCKLGCNASANCNSYMYIFPNECVVTYKWNILPTDCIDEACCKKNCEALGALECAHYAF